MDAHLSKRSAASLNRLDLPWRFASAQTYNARTNPDGLISFATAENVSTLTHVDGALGQEGMELTGSTFTRDSSPATCRHL